MSVSCVVLLPTREFGGHERMLVHWLRQAALAHGLSVRIYSAANEALIRECDSAGLPRPVVRYARQAGPIGDFLTTWALLDDIPRHLPLLLAPGVLQASPLQWLAIFLRGRQVAGYVPMAYSSRRMRFRGGRLRDWLVGLAVRRVDAWITVSREQRALLVERWRVRPPVVVLPNRLPLLGTQAPPPRAAAGRALRVLFAGRFDANQKGLDWLCERLRASAAEWRGKVSFTFMGQGRFGPQLVALSRELGAAHVAVRGWGDAREAMLQADVLLLPSRFEGVPLVALEAIHYGVPVLASRLAGVAELLPAACLFELGDGQAMWRALEGLREPARRAAALEHMRRRMAEMLSPASFQGGVARSVALLDALARRAPEAARP